MTPGSPTTRTRHRYRRVQRWTDAFRGWRDGRRGLPALDAEFRGSGPDVESLTTPYMLELYQRHAAFVAGSAPSGGERRQRVVDLTAQVADLEARVERFPDDPPPLRSRVAGFLGLTPEEIETEERLRHDRRRQDLHRRLARARNELGVERGRLAGLEEDRIRSVDGHAAHVRERLLVYLGALVRIHPYGESLQRWSTRSVEFPATDVATDERRLGPARRPALEEGRDGSSDPDPGPGTGGDPGTGTGDDEDSDEDGT